MRRDVADLRRAKLAKHSPMAKVIGKNIRRIRRACRMTQLDLTKRLGHVDDHVVSNWESGATKIGADTLYRIAEILNTPIQDFFR